MLLDQVTTLVHKRVQINRRDPWKRHLMTNIDIAHCVDMIGSSSMCKLELAVNVYDVLEHISRRSRSASCKELRSNSDIVHLGLVAINEQTQSNYWAGWFG